MKLRKSRILLSLILIVAIVAAMGTLASAAVAGFAGGGGNNPLNPVGFAYVTNHAVTGQYALTQDHYTMLNSSDTVLAPLDPDGQPWTFLFFAERNPYNATVPDNGAFIRLDQNGSPLSGFASIVASSASRYDLLGGAQDATWRFPIFMSEALETGCAYEIKVLRGMIGNNGVSAVVYEDALGVETGYLKIPFTADEQAQYDIKKTDVYQVRTGDHTYTDFIFRFRTEADITPFSTALADAETALAAALGNTGDEPGQYPQAAVDSFSAAVQTARDRSEASLKALLQTELQALADDLADGMAVLAESVNPAEETTENVTEETSEETTAASTGAETTDTSGEVPATGENPQDGLLVVGLMLIAGAAALGFYRIRKTRQE